MSKDEFMKRYLKDKEAKELKHKLDIIAVVTTRGNRTYRRACYGRRGLGQP